MKKIIYLLLLTVLIAACKKKKSNNTPPAQNASSTQNQNCRISKYEHTEGEDPITIVFDYDDKGNLIKVVRTDGLIETYAYSKKSIVYERKQKDVVFSETITYNLDDSDRIVSADVRYSIVDNKAVRIVTEDVTYKYTNDGYLSVITMKERGYNDIITYTYTWQNGNIASIEHAHGELHIVTTSFQYGSEIFPVNYNMRFEWVAYYIRGFLNNYFGKMPKNLPSRATQKEKIKEYAYQKDDKGNVIKYTEVLKTPGKKDETKSVMYYYNCK